MDSNHFLLVTQTSVWQKVSTSYHVLEASRRFLADDKRFSPLLLVVLFLLPNLPSITTPHLYTPPHTPHVGLFRPLLMCVLAFSDMRSIVRLRGPHITELNIADLEVRKETAHRFLRCWGVLANVMMECTSRRHQRQKGDFPPLIKDGKVIRCMSESHVSIVAASQEARKLDVPEKEAGDRLHVPSVHAPRDRPRMDQQSDVRSQENPGHASGDRFHATSFQAPGDRSHKVPEWLNPFEDVVERTVVEPKEKTPDEMRVSSEKSQPIFLSSQKCPREQTNANQLARTIFLHTILQIRVVNL